MKFKTLTQYLVEQQREHKAVSPEVRLLIETVSRACKAIGHTVSKGALGGVLAALLLRRRDPLPPRQRYSWEDEEDAAAHAQEAERSELELPAPTDVPVLWQREDDAPARGVVLPFRPPSRRPPPP